jgi:mRNA interferase RelE/StbE
LSYKIELVRGAERDLRRLPDREVERILAAIRRLEENPSPRGALKLGGVGPPLWRLRVGEYRVIYGVPQEHELVLVEAILRRDSQTYRRLPS